VDRFEELRTFVRVVECGGISTAARRLGLAKSAVSRRLAELEERLGVQLLRRSTRSLRLTESGRGLYERALRLLEDLEEAEQAVTQAHGRLQGTLRITVPLSFGLRHLSPAITDFAREHPQVRFELDLDDRQADLLREGYDLAVRIARLPDSRLVARRLAVIRSCVCASPAYLERHGAPRRAEELAERPCLLYTNLPDPALWRYRDPKGREGKVRVRGVLRANNGDFLCQAAAAGLGLVLGPTFVVHEAIRRGELVPVLTDHRWPTLEAHAVWPHTRHLSRRVRALVDFLAERFAGVPYWDRELPL